MITKKEITPSMIETWIGSDNLSVDHFLGLLAEIANGDYHISVFRNDVLAYMEEQEQENA